MKTESVKTVLFYAFGQKKPRWTLECSDRVADDIKAALQDSSEWLDVGSIVIAKKVIDYVDFGD